MKFLTKGIEEVGIVNKVSISIPFANRCVNTYSRVYTVYTVGLFVDLIVLCALDFCFRTSLFSKPRVSYTCQYVTDSLLLQVCQYLLVCAIRKAPFEVTFEVLGLSSHQKLFPCHAVHLFIHSSSNAHLIFTFN